VSLLRTIQPIVFRKSLQACELFLETAWGCIKSWFIKLILTVSEGSLGPVADYIIFKGSKPQLHLLSLCEKVWRTMDEILIFLGKNFETIGVKAVLCTGYAGCKSSEKAVL
jgi:hypothetical protein